MTKTDEIVDRLVATGKWSARTARLGIRANFTCEYCGKSLIDSEDNYKLWQVDHIVPISSGGDEESEDNLAIACRQCNMDFKSRWNPLSIVSSTNPARAELIQAVRNYVLERRRITQQELQHVRAIIGINGTTE